MSDENKLNTKEMYARCEIDRKAIETSRKDLTWAEYQKMVKQAADHWNYTVMRDLYSGKFELRPLSEQELKEIRRRGRIRKLLAPWYWLRRRVVGTYEVWRYGDTEAGRASYDD